MTQGRLELLHETVVENGINHLTPRAVGVRIDGAPQILAFRSLECGQIDMRFGKPVVKIDIFYDLVPTA